jgi:SAM-dependent methyltransferase
MDPNESWHHTWATVDHTTNPEFFIRFLDASRAEAHAIAEAHPQQFFARLGVQPGDRILDVGCGTGDLLRPLTRLVGTNGRVIGIDASTTMIREAQQRLTDPTLPLSYQVADAQHLPFADSIFDLCWANAVLQHISDPAQALAEMVRVTRPGGRVAIGEHDWGTFAVDSEDVELTRIVTTVLSDSIAHGWIGRQLPRLFAEAGLQNVSVNGTALPVGAYGIESLLRGAVERTEQSGLVDEARAAAWLADLEQKARAGRFFSAVTVFTVMGLKPEAD